ncbi:MAG: hypothetical protein P8J33_04285, partial [Pirellulaceae bacterium]|nr:hypothetical protein [Pirellulaceae bacterium]
MPQTNQLLHWQFPALCLVLILGLVGCQPAEKKPRVSGTIAPETAGTKAVSNASQIAARQAKLVDLPAIQGQP